MTSRRAFLRIGLAATVLPVAVRAEAPMPIWASEVVPLYKILYDTRFPASVAFARRAAANGTAVQAMSGDMTRFWYEDLYYRWRQGPAAIAGLTAHGALFCLERLAWDQRMRVVFRGEHSHAADGAVAHCFVGPPPLLKTAVRAVTEDIWAAGLADVVTQCPAARAPLDAVSALTANVAVPPSSQTLFSWVIASTPHA